VHYKKQNMFTLHEHLISPTDLMGSVLLICLVLCCIYIEPVRYDLSYYLSDIEPVRYDISHYPPDIKPVRYDFSYYLSDIEPVKYDISYCLPDTEPDR
jgi:hypothetical protein